MARKKKHRIKPQKAGSEEPSPKGFASQLTASRPKLKESIDFSVQEAIEIASRVDPLSLLAAVAGNNIFGTSPMQTEDEAAPRFTHVEYTQSLVLGINRDDTDHTLSDTDFLRFSELIENIFNDVSLYFGFEGLTLNSNQDRNELRKLSVLQRLHIRGEASPQHELDLAEGIFSPFSTELKSRFGFEVSDLRRATIAIVEQIESNAQVLGNRYRRAHETYESALSKLATDNSDLDSEGIRELLIREPPSCLIDALVQLQAVSGMMPEIFCIEPNCTSLPRVCTLKMAFLRTLMPSSLTT